VLVVHPSVPSKSVPELIAYAKSNPGKITVASAGIGSAPHMYWELFRSLTGVDMLHVPYRGGGPAVIDLLGGQVQVYFGTMASSIEYIRAGNYTLGAAYLSRGANVGTSVGRDHFVNLIAGHRHPFAVHFDFVVVAHHATLGRATIHHAATRTSAVVSPERRVEVLMPFIVADAVISVLRRCA
jgi:hypothetical protein